MRNLVLSAIRESSKKVELEEQDVSKVDKQFLKENKISDFPTIVFFRGDKPVFKYSGTVPMIIIVRWIDVYFKAR
jgi:thiol-disulfide isomerase/thioredoxin